MQAKERLLRQLAGEEVDRIPLVGGWNLGLDIVCELAGMSRETYLADPLGGVIEANLKLGIDALALPIIPQDPAAIRAGKLEQHDFSAVEPEALLERAEKIPDSAAKVIAAFDPVRAEAELRGRVEALLYRLRDRGLEFFPNFWDAGANFSLYFEYGYEAFLAAVALYPEAIERIYWENALQTAERNKVLIRLMREWELIPAIFCGCDICDNRGPMVSPEYLRGSYWPHVRTSLAPLLDAGIRLIHHCDGNVMALLDDMLASGFTGFQGFQTECGVDPAEIRRRTLAHHSRPLLLGGLSVTRTLPSGSPAEVRAEVDRIFEVTSGGRGLFLFTSNCTGVETPVENIRTAYRYAAGKKVGL